jgi:anti-sigma factor RsiW
MARPAVCCVELVEAATDWMEGAVDDDDRRRLEEHLVDCPHCAEYVSQLRSTSRVLAGVGGRDAPPATARAALLDAFRLATRR